MRLLKKILAIMLACTLVAGTVCACKKSDSSETTAEANTVATKLAASFIDLSQTDSTVDGIVNKLCEDEVFTDIAMGSIEVEPGYLNGFTEEVTGFTGGYMFAPMIGTMPFVGYVLVTDDAEALVDELTSKADLRWNICTEADEMVSETAGDLVFFCMAPFAFDA